MPKVSSQSPSYCACGDHAFLAMKRGVTMVDLEHAALLHGNAFFVNGGYAQSRRIGKLHRAVVGSKSPNVDHRNHDKLDNRRRNLRECSEQQNQFNKRPNAKGKSAYKGVSWLSRQECWVVRISLNRKKIWVGAFKDEMEAAKAYDAAAKRFFGQFAFINFKDGGGLSHPQ